MFAFAGIAVWQYFTRIISEGGGSLIASSALITKVSFPRLIIPLVSPIAAGVDCLIAILALAVADGSFWGASKLDRDLCAARYPRRGACSVMPSRFGSPRSTRSIATSALCSPFVIQIAMYLSPIVYPASLVPEKIRWLYELNPVAVMVNSMRWVVLGTDAPSLAGIVVFALAPCFSSGVVRRFSGAWRSILLTGFDWPVGSWRLVAVIVRNLRRASGHGWHDCGD